MSMKAVSLTVRFTVHPDTDEHLHTEQAIRDEVTSWLESLRAAVQTVTVKVGAA